MMHTLKYDLSLKHVAMVSIHSIIKVGKQIYSKSAIREEYFVIRPTLYGRNTADTA